MLIGFVTSGIPFTGDSLNTGSLGGSETALASVSRELVKLGHTVRVFCRCSQPGLYDGVEYYDIEHAQQQIMITHFDVLIASRWPDPLAVPSNVGLRVLWNHDVLTDPAGLMPRLWQTDLLMCLSDYHINDYCGPEDTKVKGKLPELRPYIWKTSNGVDTEIIEKNKRPKVPGKLIYTSRPERGLYHLLKDIFPKLLEKRPDLRLHYCTYDLSGMDIADEMKALYAECDKLAARFGKSVVNMGSLSKSGLYSQMSSAQLMVYPSNFPEISCIGIMESQQCGTPIVSTDDFAIKETAGQDSAILIKGLPHEKEYIDNFVNAVDSLLDENNVLNEEGQRLAENGPKFVQEKEYTWDKVARSWDVKFSNMLETRYMENKPAIVKTLLQQNDVQAASLFAKKVGLSQSISEIESHDVVIENESKDITAKIKEVAPLYKKLIYTVVECISPVATILDLFCDDASFGLSIKRAVDSLDVTLLAKDEDAAQRLHEYGTNLELSCVVTADTERIVDKYDVVFIGDAVDKQKDPQGYLDRISKKYLNEGGMIVGYSNYGSKKLKWSEPSNRYWNLSRTDFEDLFADESGEYRLIYHDLREDKQLDPYGWFGFAVSGYKKFCNFDVIGRAKRTIPYKMLDVGMIIKDEEDWILGALKSVAGVADKITVIDTGCSDHTREILKWHDADVIESPFEDFSQARNITRDVAEGDWYLWIDADERLVKPELIRQYIRSEIFSGFAIAQRHLMLDLQGTHDLPVRLLKNKPQYRFTGAIHEHCEDVSKNPYDDPIEPTLELECDIAHYGYLNEQARRSKCSYRNMSLLLKDIKDNASKGRMLTWVLVMRDYLNICKWEFWKNGPKPVAQNSVMHVLLNAVISTHLNIFADDSTRYTCLAEGLYQEALKILGMSGLPYEGCEKPPFEVDLALVGAVGGVDPEKHTKPDKRWFLDAEEFVAFLHNKGVDVVTGLNLCNTDECSRVDAYAHRQKPALPDAERLLKMGVSYR